jgi:hypothetical protein
VTGPSSLAQGIPDPSSNSVIRTGVVTSVSARGISVAISAGTVNASHLDSYAPAVGDTVAVVKTQDSWLAMGRVVGSGTPVDFTAPGSAAGLSILAAMRTEGTSALVSTIASVAVPKYTLSYYHPPGHNVLILAFFTWISNNSTDWVIADLTETTTGAAVGEFVQPQVNASFGRADLMTGIVKDTLGGAKRIVSMTFGRLTGAGTSSLNQNDARPGYMIALDLGDKSVIIPT